MQYLHSHSLLTYCIKLYFINMQYLHSCSLLTYSINLYFTKMQYLYSCSLLTYCINLYFTNMQYLHSHSLLTYCIKLYFINMQYLHSCSLLTYSINLHFTNMQYLRFSWYLDYHIATNRLLGTANIEHYSTFWCYASVVCTEEISLKSRRIWGKALQHHHVKVMKTSSYLKSRTNFAIWVDQRYIYRKHVIVLYHKYLFDIQYHTHTVLF